eukprot:GHVQ01024645.1.p1 GENE.GHVQ01024645.1~~GHVQ01024645.1.p1  ORF type:complete len:125 (+),score=21.89 GHVQ01024645.1:141-515(+)
MVESAEMPNQSMRQEFRDIQLQQGTVSHPVHTIQKQALRDAEAKKMRSAGVIYGLHAPLKLKMEREMLSHTQRLPGLRSSLIGLHTAMGLDTELTVEDYMNVDPPTEPYKAKCLNEYVERQLGV